MKTVAPSRDLRRRFHEGSLQWKAFRQRYLSELKAHRSELRELAKRARNDRVTLVFGAKDEAQNNAAVVKQYLEMLKV